MLGLVLINGYCMKKITLLLPLFCVFLFLSGCLDTGCCSEPDIDPVKLKQDAYSLQRISVLQHSINDPIIGFKAALTSEQEQDAFNVDEPLVGALFLSGFSRGRTIYLLNKFQDLRLELELGYILRKPITKPITKEQLPQYIKAMAPIVELPNIRFARKEQMTPVTLITSNVASNHFIMGATRPFAPELINDYQASLSKNGVIINQGVATDAMGDQKEALVWMINRLLQAGYQLNQDHLLITGALGTMMRAEKGQYEAQFGTDLSNEDTISVIAFSVR